jgi:hypothetical protein
VVVHLEHALSKPSTPRLARNQANKISQIQATPLLSGLFLNTTGAPSLPLLDMALSLGALPHPSRTKYQTPHQTGPDVSSTRLFLLRHLFRHGEAPTCRPLASRTRGSFSMIMTLRSSVVCLSSIKKNHGCVISGSCSARALKESLISSQVAELNCVLTLV